LNPPRDEEEEVIYICSSRLGLIKMDHHHFGNGRTTLEMVVVLVIPMLGM
jgi:hypothetical protein